MESTSCALGRNEPSVISADCGSGKVVQGAFCRCTTAPAAYSAASMNASYAMTSHACNCTAAEAFTLVRP